MIVAMRQGPRPPLACPSRMLGGLDRPVSRIILGMSAATDDLPRLWDAFVELGGNAIDSAHSYPNEVSLGRWLARRPDRDELIIVGKAGHPHRQGGQPRIRPSDIEQDLVESLDRLGRDRIDLFLLHRDDETIPVGEIMGALADHRAAGRILATGGSNWTTDRLAEADAWTRAHGVPPFDASSPNLSLAVPMSAPWPGCLTAGDPASLAWYEREQLPLISWSPLARGFFADSDDAGDRARPSGPDQELEFQAATQAFDTADNRSRRQRARALAAELGVSTNEIALAWVMNQPFPTWATVGAVSIGQIEQSIAASGLALTADQVRWLADGGSAAGRTNGR